MYTHAHTRPQELEKKDDTLVKKYEAYLTSYATTCSAGATPECMHPGDLPSVNFLVDLILHICAMPVSPDHTSTLLESKMNNEPEL